MAHALPTAERSLKNSMGNEQLGPWGEYIAGEYLKSKGYRIVFRNFCCKRGEIDLIVENRQYLVFVEVKLRKSADFADARAFVDYRKQQKIKITAMLYLSTRESRKQPRFDVIEIYAPQGINTPNPTINHLEDAFQ